MAITDRTQAKKGGWAQVREALVKFEGTVTKAGFDEYPPKTGVDGEMMPKKEFLEIECNEVEVLEVTEELTMTIDEYNFRVNCSDFEGSFWVERFLESADKVKLQIPEELVGKRVVWEKVTLEAFDKGGQPTPKFNSTNYIIAGVKGETAPAKPAPTVVAKAKTPEVVVVVGTGEAPDLAEMALEFAVGKTEAQLKTAIAFDPAFASSPLLSLIKSGVLTTQWVNEGKLVVVDSKYQKPE